MIQVQEVSGFTLRRYVNKRANKGNFCITKLKLLLGQFVLAVNRSKLEIKFCKVSEADIHIL